MNLQEAGFEAALGQNFAYNLGSCNVDITPQKLFDGPLSGRSSDDNLSGAVFYVGLCVMIGVSDDQSETNNNNNQTS